MTLRPLRSTPSDRRFTGIAVALLAAATLAAYANSFAVPLMLDDWATLLHNPQLRTLTPWWSIFVPAEATGVGGRPIANVSFVLNYAASGLALGPLHAVNLAIHLGAALALFGVVRRTLQTSGWPAAVVGGPPVVALLIAGMWVLHPVQTQSVTYVSQRTEALMGMFYFLTFYCFVRSVDADGPRAGAGWRFATVACCFAGMGTKEGMVTAPFLLALYDFAFVTRSFARLWRERGRFYLALASSWLLLAFLMRGLGGRGVGFGHGMSSVAYLLTECGAIVRYAALALWPAPLVFDYGTDLGAPGLLQIGCGILLVAVAALTLFALWRAPRLGFIGAWFLVTLSPTSSIVPIPLQPISENRVYVPLAAMMVGLVLAVAWLLGRRASFVLGAVALLWGGLTFARNHDYRSLVAIWTDTVAKHPESSRAHNNLGQAWLAAGNVPAARAAFEQALVLKPTYAGALVNYAALLGQLGEHRKALELSRHAAVLDPTDANAFYNLGVALNQSGDVPGAIAAYERSLQLSPTSPGAHGNLGILYLQQRRLPEAIAHSEAALRLDPSLVFAHNTLASSLALSGRWDEAIAAYGNQIRLTPGDADAWANLGICLQQRKRMPEAVAAWQNALKLNPGHVMANFHLGGVALGAGQVPEALALLETALRGNPRSVDTLVLCGVALARAGRLAEAESRLEAALALDPASVAARRTLEELRAARAGAPLRK
jgi:protein O-mannosyl-transferase